MYSKDYKTTYIFSLFFLLIGLAFSLIGFWYVTIALNHDVPLASVLVTFVFFVLFAVVSILYGFVLLKDRKNGSGRVVISGIVNRPDFYPVVGMLSFGLAPILFAYYNSDAMQFNKKREAAFQEMRPAFVKFVDDHGSVPKELNDLVPEYLSKIPGIIMVQDKVNSFKYTRYDTGRSGNFAHFYYTTGGINNAEMYYDMIRDIYSPAGR